MPRHKSIVEKLLIGLPDGTIAWIKRGLQPGETVTAFVRLAIETLLRARKVPPPDTNVGDDEGV